MKNVKITIFTRVYNTKEYLRQCVSSVLTQSFSDFEYVIVDNGSTDGSSDLLEDFAASDKRIQLIRKKENRIGPWALEMTIDLAKGQYFTVLDSDDWWEPNYLERLIGFLEDNHLDLAVTGTCQYFEKTQTSQVMRKLQCPIILSQQEFAQNYPYLWTFPSTVWGSIIKTKLIYNADVTDVLSANHFYGGDTMIMLQYIKQCSRIGIDDSALYHYRIHPKSISYQYNPRRFDANVAYYEQIKDFLELHHTLDDFKQGWLQQVHLKSMDDTLRVLADAKLSEDERIAECARIAAHPLTPFVLTNDCPERADWYILMWQIVLRAMDSGALSGSESLRRTLERLAPHCWRGIGPENCGLFAKEPSLLEALVQDDAARMAGIVMEWIAHKRYVKQYDLGGLVCGLLPAGSPLRGIADARFYMKYAPACRLILQGERLAALDWMTSLLLEHEKLYDGGRFLEVYLTLAALEEQTPAFLFGKLRQARLLLEQGQREKSRAVADELAGMGLENEEMDALLRDLEAGV